MPNPDRRSAYVATPVADFTIANLQESSEFNCLKVAPVLPVDQQEGKYFVYDSGDLNRYEMSPRGSSEESAGSGWRLSNGSYACENYAVHKDFDWSDVSTYDKAIEPAQDAAAYLALQAKLHGETLLGSEVFAASIWTQDWDGASSKAYSSSEILYWSSSSSTPKADVQYIASLVAGQCGMQPNTILVGRDVHLTLLEHSDVKDMLKYTQSGSVDNTNKFLASYLGMQNYYVGTGFQNSSKEGQTASYGTILDADDVWIGVVNPKIGKKVMTALRTFAYKDGGRATDGISVRTFDIPQIRSTRYEMDIFWDLKVVSTSAGAFIDEAVA